MGKQSKLKKLKRECRAVVNENNATKTLDDMHKEALIDEVYRKSKESFINASAGSRKHKPKQGRRE
jgi:hypothetical protein